MHAMTTIAWTIVLGAQNPSDLSFADPDPAAEAPLTPQAIEALTTPVVPAGPELEVPAGDVRFVETKVPLSGPEQASLRAVPVSIRSGRGITVLPWAEVVEVKNRAVVVRYILRARPTREPTVKVRFLLEVRNWQDATLGRLKVNHQVRITKATLTAPIIDHNRQAYVHHQSRARIAYDNLPELHDYLRLDRVDRPPSPSRISPDQIDAFSAFLHHRLRADIARRRLRTAATGDNSTLAAAAVRALGSLSKKPTGPAERARAIEGVAPPRALKMATAALQNLQFDVAEGFLNKLRTSGQLNAEQLATALSLLGGVYAARGRTESMKRAYGQALCIDPKLSSPVSHGFFTDALEAMRKNSGCKTPIAVRQIEAARIIGLDDLPAIRVTVDLRPDPFEVISGGEVQIFGYGGAVFTTQSVRATDGQLIATFEDPGVPENAAGQILIKVWAKDTSGVDVVTKGVPDPVTVTLQTTEAFEDEVTGTPWWVWALVWGAVVAGAGAGTAIWAANRDSEVTRGIGPIDVRF